MEVVQVSGHTPWSEIKKRPYQKWYQFGWRWRSVEVLWKRSRLANWHPRRSLRAFWQRGRRGWADEDVWSFHSYLARVIREGIRELACINHGHPAELTVSEWAAILAEIEEGMWAATRLDEASYIGDNPETDKALFDTAMTNLHKWFFALWD
jgi:hypothetical protein